MDTRNDLRLAVLIDADNVSHTYVTDMLGEIAKYGTPTFKRIYADWTKQTVSGWKNVLLENAITPVQQYSYTSGKNSSDSALIIDAMDILYSGKVEGFCIVSSDSDFTRLATRLREAGMKVIGIGEKKTPAAFIKACEKFIYLEILRSEVEEEIVSTRKKSVKSTSGKDPIRKVDPRLVRKILDAVADLADEEGWTFLGELGSFLLKKQPDFDPRNYGFNKLLTLIKSTGRFVVDERLAGKGNVRHVYIKAK
jgi:uncharacterized LabA/DUF88 family protein